MHHTSNIFTEVNDFNNKMQAYDKDIFMEAGGKV